MGFGSKSRILSEVLMGVLFREMCLSVSVCIEPSECMLVELDAKLGKLGLKNDSG